MTASAPLPKLEDIRIAVIGLGYVGLPLAVEFGKSRSVIGFDIREPRLNELRGGHDATLEISDSELKKAVHLELTSDPAALEGANFYIVTVPTPIDSSKRPDLSPLISASTTIGKALKRGDIVVYESTVYPGATEEDCVPVLERHSGLRYNLDFYAGYSPERINPGDKLHRLPDILKVTAGSTPEVAELVDQLYASIIRAGTFKAKTIKVAEAAKVIENTQRDVNIALVNELAIIFNRLGIDTMDVLKAAETKWNFLPFRPGLVGGHCIGVDPYYLTHKAQQVGHHSEVVLSGRRINDNMGQHVTMQIVRLMIKRELPITNARALILGMTFKENCPDLRNTKVVDVYEGLREFGMQIDVHDPHVDADEAKREYGIDLCQPEDNAYDCIILTVAHEEFIEKGARGLRRYGKDKHVLYDVKNAFPAEHSDGRL